MRVPDISYTLATVAPSVPLELEADDLVLLVFMGEHDQREEVLWVQVLECLQYCTHRARVLSTPVLFHDLPEGEVIYFRPEHILRVRLCSGEHLMRVTASA